MGERMSRFDESLFGRVAVINGYVSKAALESFLRDHRESGSEMPIGEALVARGLLTREQLERILEIRQKKVRKLLRSQRDAEESDRAFARHVLLHEMVGTDELEDAVLEQLRLRQLNLHFSLPEVLFSRRKLTLQQVLEVLAAQGRAMLRCSLCDVQYQVAARGEGEEHRCPRCDAVLDPPLVLDPLMVEGVAERVEAEAHG